MIQKVLKFSRKDAKGFIPSINSENEKDRAKITKELLTGRAGDVGNLDAVCPQSPAEVARARDYVPRSASTVRSRGPR